MRLCHFRESWGANSGNAAGEATAPRGSNKAFTLFKFLELTVMSGASLSLSHVEGLCLSSQWLNWLGSLSSLILSYRCELDSWSWFIFLSRIHFWSCAFSLSHSGWPFKSSKDGINSSTCSSLFCLFVYMVAFWWYKPFPLCRPEVSPSRSFCVTVPDMWGCQ